MNFANDHLKRSRERLVLYGASLGDQDTHIAEAVKRGTARAAVSVFIGNRSVREVEREMLLMRAALVGVDLAFFDSSTLFN
jgi:hypothetical protein